MKNVLAGLLGVVLLLVLINSQDAYAVDPDCTTAGVRNLLAADHMYVGTTNGSLVKVDAVDPDKGTTCIFPNFMTEESSGTVLICQDLALHPTNGLLYCIFGNKLYTINRDEPEKSPDAIGSLKDGGFTINKINALEFDHGGNLYAARNNGGFACDNTGGSFYDVNVNNAKLTFRGNLGGKSSGDLIYNHVGANMFWTSECCPGCVPGNDGLFVINLNTNMATFKVDLGHTDVFAGDMVTSGNICYVTKQGILFETDNAGNVIGLDMDIGALANGGTANQILVGGVSLIIDKISLLLAGFDAFSGWITSVMLAGLGIAAFMLRGNISNQRKKNINIL